MKINLGQLFDLGRLFFCCKSRIASLHSVLICDDSDEADVFLDARDKNDMGRNALVSGR